MSIKGGYRFSVQEGQYLTVGSIDGPTKVDRGTVSFGGQIIHVEYGPTSFSLEREPSDDLTQFTRFRFFNTPGWNLNDYRSEELSMWKDVKERIDSFYN